ncbi:MAG: rod shape-determining protein MreD [Alphaproteobacteria bacterium]|nr:rod shape-determining protein MreD [Alphaproteobacteria bacterium]
MLGRMNFFALAVMPFILTVALVLVGIAQWPLPSPVSTPPQFGLIAVFYWAIHRPGVLPVVAVFVIGLIQDTLGGDPIGLNALIYLFAYSILRANGHRFEDKSFFVEWAAFAATAAAAVFLTWIVMSLRAEAFLGLGPALTRFALDLAVYPIFAWIFGLIRRGMVN